MGILFSKCCEVEINFRCTLCNKRSSIEPEVPIKLSNTNNEEEGTLFIVIVENDVDMYGELRIS